MTADEYIKLKCGGRNFAIFKFRQNSTLKATGEKFGLSSERTRQIEARVLRHRRYFFRGLAEKDTFYLIPTQAKNALAGGGWKTERAIVEGIKKGFIFPSSTYGYGRKLHKKVCEIYGLD